MYICIYTNTSYRVCIMYLNIHMNIVTDTRHNPIYTYMYIHTYQNKYSCVYARMFLLVSLYFACVFVHAYMYTFHKRTCEFICVSVCSHL